jgi:hypothetical protein
MAEPTTPLTDQQLTPAEIRLAQYGQRTSTWSTATYNDGTEKALHEIALGLKAEIDQLRAELAAARANGIRYAADLVTNAFHGEPFLNYPPDFADLLREHADRLTAAAQGDTVTDTLAAWLYQRFINAADAAAWDTLGDADRSYWEHQARAVRRAVARGGFKHRTQTEA